MKKQTKIITTAQFHARISRTTNAYNQTAIGGATQIRAYKQVLEAFNLIRPHLPSETVEAAVKMVAAANEVIECVVLLLEKGKDVVGAPPSFYPYSTDRLDEWEMSLAGDIMQEVINRFDLVVEVIISLGTIVDEHTAKTAVTVNVDETVAETEGVV